MLLYKVSHPAGLKRLKEIISRNVPPDHQYTVLSDETMVIFLKGIDVQRLSQAGCQVAEFQRSEEDPTNTHSTPSKLLRL